jgi:hypothetical protein
LYSPIFLWYYHYYIVFTNIRVILPLLHCIHQYSCDSTTVTLYSTIFVWYYHNYIVFTNSRVILPLLHCIHQYSCDATIITLRYCDVPEYTPCFYWDPCYLIFTDVQGNVFVSQFCRIYTTLCNWMTGTKCQSLKWQWILFFWCICIIVSYINYMVLPLFV